MSMSVLDMFRVGIGPSSSHTMGPMKAVTHFLDQLKSRGELTRVDRVRVNLYGSLAATGRGHQTDVAIMMALMGEDAATVDVDSIAPRIEALTNTHQLMLDGTHRITFDPQVDMVFEPQCVPTYHTNAMTLTALSGGEMLYTRRYYSVGGGFIVPAREDDMEVPEDGATSVQSATRVPYPFTTGRELIDMAIREGKSIAEMARANEEVLHPGLDVKAKCLSIWHVMKACRDRGLRQEGSMPGPFKVGRRAKGMYERCKAHPDDPFITMDWVNVYAIAVSEENATGGRVVTAPTNGAAGVIPAVMSYYLNHVKGASEDHLDTFLLTAGAIGTIFKINASISGAEAGCQAEVGVACSMAAAGLAAVLGGTPQQIENAAEIGMEHNLGLTCDPVAGQVQIPCIERNAIAAVKAINAARMALQGNGTHYVSLDQVVRTMMETGKDMQAKYKETSLGGLAINIRQC